MSKKMLINTVHPEEARVAIVQDGRLVELDVEIEGSEQIRGNVYKGVVVRVEPGLQAAFVDIGLKKLGFLQAGELHQDFWQWREDIPEDQRKRRPRIQEVLRRGQELVVQVEKGERDMKGAALTTYLSLPGRYMVIMPGDDSAGVSRKVENEQDRKTLKELAGELTIPEGFGYIMRTEALGKKKTELAKDLQSLLKLHKEMIAKAAKTKAPALIYQESDLVIRTIRDYFTSEIDEVLVDSPEVFQQAKAFFKRNMPKFENVVKLHQEKRPIFSKYQLEEQIDQIYEKKVVLKSGGSLVIEPTEALVSIDVNSGKSTGEKGVEDTAFKTNLEAAEEVARQLRLRDLGGLIVIDFIDMRDKKHMAEVEKTLKLALKTDKARVTVGKISQFGMLEMSRQRIKQNLDTGAVLECPHCSGRGKVKSVESVALSFLRKVHGAAARGSVSEVRGELPLEVAYYLLNRKKKELVRIENDYDIEVTVKGKPSFLMNQLEVEHIRREKSTHAEHMDQVAETLPIMAPENVKEEEAAPLSPASAEPAAAEAVLIEEVSPEPAAETEQAKKKRRRKRKRGKGGTVEIAAEAAIGGSPSVQEPPEEPTASADQPAEPESTEQGEVTKKKKRRRRRRSKSQTAENLLPVAEEVQEEAERPEEITLAMEEGLKVPPVTAKPPRKWKQQPPPPVETTTVPETAESTKTDEKKPKRTRKPRMSVKSTESAATDAGSNEDQGALPGVSPSPAEEEHAQKKRRASKKKVPVKE